MRSVFNEPANWVVHKDWKFGVDANAYPSITRGHLLQRGRKGAEIRYRDNKTGVIYDWPKQKVYFDTLREAEEFLHEALVDDTVLRFATADPPNLVGLKKRLYEEPSAFVLPTHVSVNGAPPLTADSSAKALHVLMGSHRWLSGDLLDSFMNMLNRQTNGVDQYLHRGVFRKPGGEPGRVLLDDDVQEISQPVVETKVRIRRSIAKYEAHPHYAYYKKLLRRLIVPVHIDGPQFSHWFLAVVDFEDKKFLIWDSMPMENDYSYEWILPQMVFLRDEVARKSLAEWPFEIRRDVLQDGTSDCGVFVCSFATAFARGATPLCVTKEKVQRGGAFRNEMLIALCKGKVEGVPVPY